mgnify:CR=1 FL=1
MPTVNTSQSCGGMAMPERVTAFYYYLDSPEQTTKEALSRFLSLAVDMICRYCHISREEYFNLADLRTAAFQIACAIYNRRGVEGCGSYSEGGVSQSYDELLTPDIRRQLAPYRRMVC